MNVDIEKDESLKERGSSAKLDKGLSYRHIMLLSLGGAIGAGLFMGSGKGIALAGPSLILAYAISGLFVFIIARALGELLINNELKNFSDLGGKYIGPWAGYITGWTYWMNWILVGIAEVSAVGMLTHFWFPELPQWIPALVVVVLLTAVNQASVKHFGEFEFWFALIKILTIVVLIVGGTGYILLGQDNTGVASFNNIFSSGKFFPSGIDGFIRVLPIAAFSFGGIEIIGLIAAETKDFRRNIPRAINALPLRIIFFYIGSIVIIMSLFPWGQMDPSQSPYVLAFDKLGLHAAAGVMTVVVITSLSSSCNSGLYATGRMLCSLSDKGFAPATMGKISASKVPSNAIWVSSAIMLFGVLLNYIMPDKIFGYLMMGVLMMLLWIWSVIILSHLIYRRKISSASISFRLPLCPFSSYLVLICIFVLFLILAFFNDTRDAVYVSLVWFTILAILWKIKTRK